MIRFVAIFLILGACASPKGGYINLYVPSNDAHPEIAASLKSAIVDMNKEQQLVSVATVDSLELDAKVFQKRTVGEEQAPFWMDDQPLSKADSAFQHPLFDEQNRSIDSLQARFAQMERDKNLLLRMNHRDLSEDTSELLQKSDGDKAEQEWYSKAALTEEQYEMVLQENRLYRDSLQVLQRALKEEAKETEPTPTQKSTQQSVSHVPQNSTASMEQLQKQLQAKDDSIRLLKNQLQSLNRTASNQRNTLVVPAALPTKNRNESDDQLIQIRETLKANNDSVLVLLNQLKQQQTISQVDTLPIDTASAAAFVTDSIMDIAALPKSSDEGQDTVRSQTQKTLEQVANYLQASDSLQLLMDRLTVLQEKVTPRAAEPAERIDQQVDTSNVVVPMVNSGSAGPKEEKVVLVAFYHSGQQSPKNEAELKDQWSNLLQVRTPKKVVLSGYADRSGSTEGNRRLTAQRLDYLLRQLEKEVQLRLLHTQNFSDRKASSASIPEERRVEITFYFDTLD